MQSSGRYFTVNITAENVCNLNSWQLAISFDPGIIGCAGLIIPRDSIFGRRDYFFPPPRINNTAGRITAFCALDGTEVTNGSGRLCTINFTGRNPGISPLILLNIMKTRIDGTYLADPLGTVIPCQATSGIVEVSSESFRQSTHNITKNMHECYVVIRTNSTITDFYFNETRIELNFNAAGPNRTNGMILMEIPKESFNGSLIVLMDNVGFCTHSQDLGTLQGNATYSFICISFAHSIRNFKIRLTVIGDLDGDRKVDVKDLALTSAAYGSAPNSANWNPVADIDGNLKVDIEDIAVIARNYGKHMSTEFSNAAQNELSLKDTSAINTQKVN